MTFPEGRPFRSSRDCDRAEIVADGVVHALGLVLGVVGAAVLMMAAAEADLRERTAVGLYLAGLLAMLGCSAAYNLWPVSPVKWLLRRFDHSAIYLLIAGTYTPFMVQLKGLAVAGGLMAGIWISAIAGIALKLFLPGRFDRFAIGFCLALGWSGIVAYDAVVGTLSATALLLLAAGGVFYSVGLVFHLWRSLRFQTAIWHGFVLLAAGCHYFAVLDTLKPGAA